jgi:predicted nucleic acid-binding Zn ribbon protein
VQFKGSGWYVTDYPKKGAGAPAEISESGGSKDTAKESKETKKEEKPKVETAHKKHKKD